MPIVIAPNIQPVAAQSAPPIAAGIVLQPGSVIAAQVLQILGNDQVRIAIGGQAIDVQSQVPLQAGQTLQLQVSQTAAGIGLAIVNQQASAAASQGLAGDVATSPDSVTLAPQAAASIATPTTIATGAQLSPVETLAVTLAAQTAATQQTSLAPLFANLGVAAGLALPPQVLQAVAQVLAQQTNLDPNLTGSDIKQAFQTSGLFLEASLASGAISPSNAVPDLKAALIVLRQALTTSLAGVTASATPGAPVAASLIPQGTTTAAAQQVPTSGDAALPPGTTPPGTTQTGTTAATAAQQGTSVAATLLAQAEQATLQSSLPSVTIIAGPETLATGSPTIAPQLAAATATSENSARAATSVIAQEILDLAASNQILPSASAPPDAAARAAATSAALNLLQEALQASPLAAANASKLVVENGQVLSLIPAVIGARTPAIDDPEFARSNLPPPPVNGALPAAQPIAPATLAAHVPVEATLQHLLADTDGAIARQTLLQVASLPGQTDPNPSHVDPSMPRWNFEIPFATPQGTAMAQFEISRDGGGNAVSPAKQVWRARFSLDVEPAGPIHALISLMGERTSVRMWAERPATASPLRAGISQLSQALSRAELQPGDIVVRDGAPVQPATAHAGHFLDRAL